MNILQKFVAKIIKLEVRDEIEYIEVIKEKKVYIKNAKKSKAMDWINSELSVIGIGKVDDVYTTGYEIKERIIDGIENAEKEVKISSPWVTNKEIRSEIKKAQRRGVRISILTGDNKDNKIIKSELEKYNSKMKNNKSGKVLHSKYCIIDNKYGVIGTFNFSENGVSNHEIAVRVSGKVILKKLNDFFDFTFS